MDYGAEAIQLTLFDERNLFEFTHPDFPGEKLVACRNPELATRMEELLRACRSVKVKRLFFVFADRHAHAWRKYIDREAFDLGKGDRALVQGGRLHPLYRITVPEDLLPTTGGEAYDA